METNLKLPWRIWSFNSVLAAHEVFYGFYVQTQDPATNLEKRQAHNSYPEILWSVHHPHSGSL